MLLEFVSPVPCAAVPVGLASVVSMISSLLDLQPETAITITPTRLRQVITLFIRLYLSKQSQTPVLRKYKLRPALSRAAFLK
jgi:hypothetical protein